MAIRIAIVEDSQENIDIMQYHLSKSDVSIEIVGVAKTMGEAALLLSRPDIDVAFLDIQLKEGTIFEVLEEVIKTNKIGYEIVFVTAHGTFENAIKGIQYACLEFINKPLGREDLEKALGKVEGKKQQSSNQDDQVSFLLAMMKEQHAPTKIGIVLPKGIIQFVPIDQIEYIEADQTISRVFLTDGSSKVSAKHLGHYAQILNDHEDFIQSSKSHLINLALIETYHHRERTIKFGSGAHVIASHRQGATVRAALSNRESGGGFMQKFNKWFGSSD